MFDRDWTPFDLEEEQLREEITEDHTDFILFPDSKDIAMNHSGITSPLDITPRMSNSNSPRGQTSNLTSALQEAGASGLHTSTNPQYLHQMDFYNGNGQSSDMSRNDMFGGSFYGNGARPILMGNRQRRESNNAGSYMGGMSWGANSINGGDWVRDE